MGSIAHRVARGLVCGCALVLGVSVTACGASQYTDASLGLTAGFKVPRDWHQIGAKALAAELKTETGSSGGPWTVAYEAGAQPRAADFLAFGITQPFVFAEAGTLTSAASGKLSYDMMRDFFLPVTSAGRQKADAQGFPLTGFKQIRDQVLTPGNGIHGVRETYDYTDGTGPADTFDEIILTNGHETQVYIVVVHCTTRCYSADQAQINNVLTSFTVSTAPFFVP